MPSKTAGLYNTLDLMPLLSYNIISYLIDNNEMIWKILKYESSDAWNQTNLTASEKRALVFFGENNVEDYRVFMDSGLDSTWTKEVCILKVSIMEVRPKNKIIANAVIGFETYCHSKIWTMNNYQTRVDTIAKEIISTLNDAEIGGLGKIYFDNNCKISLIGKIPFRGKGILMSNWVV